MFNFSKYQKKKIGSYKLRFNLKYRHEEQYFNDHPVIDTYIINEIIEDNYNIVDLGANVGYETALYLNKTKGQVHSFEPFKTVYKQLKYLKKTSSKPYYLQCSNCR